MNSFIANQPIFIAALLVVLVIYSRISARSQKIPRVPLGLFILYLIVSLSLLFSTPHIEPAWTQKISLVGTIVFYCALARLGFYFLVDLWLAHRLKGQIPKITRDVVLAIIFAVIAIILLHTRGGVNLASLLTTSAVLTMVIGLALQDTLGNLISGLALQTERPFQIGEWVSFKDYLGQVIGMTWKSTLIKTFENEVIYIPNNVVAKEVIKNYSRPEPRHVACFEIGVEYPAPPNKVRSVIFKTLMEHPKVLKDPQPHIRLISFGDFAITYQVRFWNEDFEKEKFLKADILRMLWYALRRNNIRIPFPIRDVRLHHIEEQQNKRLAEDMRSEIFSALRKIPILRPLSDDDITILVSRISFELYGDGEVVVRKGEEGASMYLIHKGNCDVSIDGEKIVATLKEGDFFGEMSLLTGEKRAATVVAKGDAQVLRIDKTAFAEIISLNPAISETLGEELLKRQTALAAVSGKKETVPPASQLVSRIKAFFGLGC